MKWFVNPCSLRREGLCLLASGALPNDEKTDLESHLAACAECRRYFEEIRNVAAPLANWENSFAQLQPNPAVRRRWETAVRTAAASNPNRRPEPVLLHLWLELIWASRRILAGFAVVWLAIFAVNLSDPDVSSASIAKAKPTPAGLMLTWERQQKLMAELIEPKEPREADKPKPSRPHSRRRPEWQTG